MVLQYAVIIEHLTNTVNPLHEVLWENSQFRKNNTQVGLGKTQLKLTYKLRKPWKPSKLKWTEELRFELGGPRGLCHSRPQSPRSFWPVAGIESSGRTRFSEYAQSIRFVFSTNQIWWEVRESRTSGVRPSHSSRSLPQARRIVGSGDENDWGEASIFLNVGLEFFS